MIQRRQFMLSAAALAVAATLPLTAAAESPAKIGFVYVSPIGQAGWTYQHDQARLALERTLGAQVQTRYVEGVPEGADAERVMRKNFPKSVYFSGGKQGDEPWWKLW